MKEDPFLRSRIMRAVKGKDTAPEMLVRRIAYQLGYRYRLHRKDLPGKPDLAFISRRKVIFVHGCFWHGHDCLRGARAPKTNTTYWGAKIARNKARDQEYLSKLTKLGWQHLIVWECEIKYREIVSEKIKTFLDRG